MKFLVIILLGIALHGNTSDTYAWDSTAAKLFPLSVGNVWSYHYTTYGPSNCFTILSQSDYIRSILGFTLMPNGKWYYQFSDDTYYRIDSINMNVYKYNSGNECKTDSLLARKNDNVFSCAYAFPLLLRVADTSLMNFWGVLRRSMQMDYISYSYRRHIAEGIGFYHEELCYSTGRYRVDLNGCIINGIQYGTITGVEIVPNELSLSFSLSQNYPNPFNPVTKIKFDISGTKVAQTILSVYDLLGREITVLVNQQLQPGSYEVDWDASSYPSGMYYYKLESNGFTETKKMVLMK